MRPRISWGPRIVCLLVVVATVMGILPSGEVYAQGIIIEPGPIFEPRPAIGGPINIDLHQIDAVIDGPIATVQVKQIFRNESNQTVEGTYVFPLPVDAAVSDFQMTVDGQTLEGQLYSRDEARAIYEAIVRQQRDPALLEYLGQGLFQTRVFPIPPGATRTIELNYSQVLDQRDGLFHFRYPLRTQQFDNAPVGTLSLRAELRNQSGLRTIYSPSHELDIERSGSDRAVVGFEESGGQPASDFDLFFGVSNAAVGLNLLSYKPAGEDGYFLLLAAPDIEVDDDAVVQRDLVLVLDVSGSMEGDKMRQAQDAAHYLVDHLNSGDRFNLIVFSTGARLWQASLQGVSDETRTDAHAWIDDLEAVGSTDINRGLLEALAQLSEDEPGSASRPEYLLFMTDGLPTQGETDPRQIMENVQNNLSPDATLRLFTFGVGYDVNTDLLNSLSRDLGGRSAYVRPEENISEAVSAFYEGIATPVLANVSVDFGDGVVIDEVYPYPLPDLFAGEQLVVAGRYREGGDVSVTLKGDVNGAPVRYEYPERSMAEAGGEPFIARLWATRKLGALLEQVRLDGPSDELVNAIVQLSLEYGIVTPYTSYLVLEPNMIVDNGGVVRPDVVDAYDAAPEPVLPSAKAAVAEGAAAAAEAPASGEEAVIASDARSRLQSATTVDESNEVRYAGGRSFVQQGWVTAPDGTQYPFWVDTQYGDEIVLETIVFGSEEYFALAQDPEMAQILALSPEMVIVQEDANGLRVTTAGSDTQLEPSVTLTPADSSAHPDEPQLDAWQDFLKWLFSAGEEN